MSLSRTHSEEARSVNKTLRHDENMKVNSRVNKLFTTCGRFRAEVCLLPIPVGCVEYDVDPLLKKEEFTRFSHILGKYQPNKEGSWSSEGTC